VTKEMNEEAKRLLRLMGVAVVEAPCEAEAQCAELVKAGKCFGVATEDMDTLTCGTPCLLRHMTYSEARKVPITGAQQPSSSFLSFEVGHHFLPRNSLGKGPGGTRADDGRGTLLTRIPSLHFSPIVCILVH